MEVLSKKDLELHHQKHLKVDIVLEKARDLVVPSSDILQVFILRI